MKQEKHKRLGGMMFGHDKNKDDDDDVVTPSTEPLNEGLLGVNNDDDDKSSDDTSTTNDSTASDDSTPADDPTDIGVNSAADLPQEDDNEPTPSEPTSSPTSAPEANDLLDIKRQALHELSPLVDHLDQTPEEKFKTTMMMIQASDDQSLVSVAYEAAKKISDDGERAQALLDIVNEINYFTQEKKD